jgi:hypothetical protein
MACEKYSAQIKDWIADAALGALAPDREPELLAHVAECDACREAYRHAQDVAAFVDRGVESLVSGAPSPPFNARLRARIAAEPAPARFRLPFVAPALARRFAFGGSSRLFALATCVLVFAIFLLFAVGRSSRHNNPNQAIPVASQNQPSPSQPVAINPPSRSAPTELPRVSDVHRALRPAPPRTSEPEVLVQPGEFAAVRQFADSTRAGRVDGAQIIAAQQPLEKPLELNPIEIPDLDARKNESEITAPANTSSRL